MLFVVLDRVIAITALNGSENDTGLVVFIFFAVIRSKLSSLDIGQNIHQTGIRISQRSIAEGIYAFSDFQGDELVGPYQELQLVLLQGRQVVDGDGSLSWDGGHSTSSIFLLRA